MFLKESASVANLLREQLALSDVCLLNKCDLVIYTFIYIYIYIYTYIYIYIYVHVYMYVYIYIYIYGNPPWIHRIPPTHANDYYFYLGC